MVSATDSINTARLVGLTEIVPVFLLALPAGHLCDVKDRRGIALAARAGMTLVSGGLLWAALTNAPIVVFFGFIALLAMVRTFYSPALDNLLPRVVPERLFGRAIALISSTWQSAAIVGPIVAGALIRAAGSAWPVFLADIVLALVLLTLFTSLPKQTPHPPEEATTWGSILAGGQFLRDNPVLLGAITLDLFAVLFGGAVALLPAFAKKILMVGPVGLGWLNAAQSIGALLMALTLTHLPPIRRNGLVMLWAVAGFGAATIVFGVSGNFWLSMLMLAVLGAMDSVSVVVRSTLLLVRVPDRMRGRVSAFNDIFVGASNELGGFESGLLARFIGPIWAVAWGGIGTILVVLLTAWRAPELRRLGPLHTDAPRPE